MMQPVSNEQVNASIWVSVGDVLSDAVARRRMHRGVPRVPELAIRHLQEPVAVVSARPGDFHERHWACDAECAFDGGMIHVAIRADSATA